MYDLGGLAGADQREAFRAKQSSWLESASGVEVISVRAVTGPRNMARSSINRFDFTAKTLGGAGIDEAYPTQLLQHGGGIHLVDQGCALGVGRCWYNF